MKSRTLGAMLLASCFTAATARAVPDTLTYSGYLEQSGAPYTGAVTAIFDLYRGPTGGTSVWTQTFPSVSVVNGAFTVQLGGGAVAPMDFSVLDGAALYLGVTLNGTPLAPRSPMLSVPYARRAELADSVPWSSVTNVSVGTGLLKQAGSNQLSVDDTHVEDVARNVCIDSPAEAVSALTGTTLSVNTLSATTLQSTNASVSGSITVPTPTAPNQAATRAYVDAVGCVFSGAETAFGACQVPAQTCCGTSNGLQFKSRVIVCGGVAQTLTTGVQACSVSDNSCC
jgi:hypothetical protein